MAAISQKSGSVQTGKVGVESAHGFGDCLFNAPLIKAISEKHGSKVTVTVRPHCADAFENLPFIDEIVKVREMHHGMKWLRENGYQYTYQITQNVKFFEFRQHGDHSLVDTPTLTGKQIGVEFDPRPLFAASNREHSIAKTIPDDKPIIAIESVYTSAQSWAQHEHMMQIVNKFKDNYRILWLSNSGCPKIEGIDNMLRFTRRECIMCLSRCKYFFSVGSGFFCATLALPREFQPKHTICLWTDKLYKYESRLNEYQWNPQITWIHNPQQLTTALELVERV